MLVLALKIYKSSGLLGSLIVLTGTQWVYPILFAKVEEVTKPLQTIIAFAILDAGCNAECLILLEQMRREKYHSNFLVF